MQTNNPKAIFFQSATFTKLEIPKDRSSQSLIFNEAQSSLSSISPKLDHEMLKATLNYTEWLSVKLFRGLKDET